MIPQKENNKIFINKKCKHLDDFGVFFSECKPGNHVETI